MRHILLWALFSLMLTACTSKGKQFFVYDEIDHYVNNIDEDSLRNLFESQPESALDSLKIEVISNDYPKKVADFPFVESLEQMGFRKRTIDKSRFAAMDRIFREKKTDGYEVTACVTTYRDILVFKKSGQVTGVVKICFECGANQVTGATADTRNLGQEDDYEKLYQLLDK